MKLLNRLIDWYFTQYNKTQDWRAAKLYFRTERPGVEKRLEIMEWLENKWKK